MKPHINTHDELEAIVFKKYEGIWKHDGMHKIITAYCGIANLTTELDEKGIRYSNALRTAIKTSPLNSPELHFTPNEFRQIIHEANRPYLHHINEDFDTILMWLDNGYCLASLNAFIITYSYRLASFGKKKIAIGYDPGYATNRPQGAIRKSHRVD